MKKVTFLAAVVLVACGSGTSPAPLESYGVELHWTSAINPNLVGDRCDYTMEVEGRTLHLAISDGRISGVPRDAVGSFSLSAGRHSARSNLDQASVIGDESIWSTYFIDVPGVQMAQC